MTHTPCIFYMFKQFLEMCKRHLLLTTVKLQNNKRDQKSVQPVCGLKALCIIYMYK